MKQASERINEILKALQTNVKALSEALGYSRPQGLYDVVSGRTKNISADLANRIVTAFPEFNRTWLITGEGDMKVDQPGTGNISQYRVTNSPVNPTATVEAFLSELGAQRRVTEKALDQFARSQDQIDRLIALLEQKANK